MELAPRVLCKRWHQGQVNTIVSGWMKRVSAFNREQIQLRQNEFRTRQGALIARNIPPTLSNIFPLPADAHRHPLAAHPLHLSSSGREPMLSLPNNNNGIRSQESMEMIRARQQDYFANNGSSLPSPSRQGSLSPRLENNDDLILLGPDLGPLVYDNGLWWIHRSLSTRPAPQTQASLTPQLVLQVTSVSSPTQASLTPSQTRQEHNDLVQAPTRPSSTQNLSRPWNTNPISTPTSTTPIVSARPTPQPAPVLRSVAPTRREVRGGYEPSSSSIDSNAAQFRSNAIQRVGNHAGERFERLRTPVPSARASLQPAIRPPLSTLRQEPQYVPSQTQTHAERQHQQPSLSQQEVLSKPAYQHHDPHPPLPKQQESSPANQQTETARSTTNP